MENTQTITDVVASKKKIFCEVTSFSKVLAAVIFITLPFIGGWIGYHYAPMQIVEIDRIVTKTLAQTVLEPATESSEKFIGEISGESFIFEHTNYTSYSLTKNGVVTTGELNTERGYGNDIDATVYILNWQKPEAEQLYFVRLTGDETHIQQLDNNRVLIPEARLEKIQSYALFICKDSSHIQASFSNTAVSLTLSNGRSMIVPQVISASGARYANSDESFVFWNKGDTAFIEENDVMTFTDCSVPEPQVQ